LAMKTLNEHSDNRRSEDRRTVERLQNAVSQTQQSIGQTLAVIHETQRLIGLAEKIGYPVISNMSRDLGGGQALNPATRRGDGAQCAAHRPFHHKRKGPTRRPSVARY
jgi:hypothetical protein